MPFSFMADFASLQIEEKPRAGNFWMKVYILELIKEIIPKVYYWR